MTKNITVIDENGIITGSTYPKRASGLVKKGRAHWIGENTICLCAHNTEGNKMSDKIYDIIDNQFSKLQDRLDRIDNADMVSISMIKSLTEMQSRSRELDIVEKQLGALNEIMGRETAAPDAKTAYERELTKHKILDVLSEMLGRKSMQESSFEYSIDPGSVSEKPVSDEEITENKAD